MSRRFWRRYGRRDATGPGRRGFGFGTFGFGTFGFGRNRPGRGWAVRGMDPGWAVRPAQAQYLLQRAQWLAQIGTDRRIDGGATGKAGPAFPFGDAPNGGDQIGGGRLKHVAVGRGSHDRKSC